MIKKCFVSIIFLTVIMFFAVGCAVNTNRLAKDYGNSARLVKVNQTLNPDAVKNLEPVSKFDSYAAEAAIERYQKSFESRNESFLPSAASTGVTSSK